MITFDIIKVPQGSFGIKVNGFSTLTQLKVAVQGPALAALNLLIQEEQTFGKLSEQVPIFHVRSSNAISVLKALSLTNKLYFNQRQLICDFYGKCAFAYRVETNGDRKPLLSGEIKDKDGSIPISKCDFLGAGPPHWFIQGIRLRFIGTNVSWKELKRLYESPTVSTDRDEMHQLLEESQEEGAPKIQILGKIEDIHEQDPLPILILKDRSGAFADLWMDYGIGKVDFHDQTTTSGIKRKLGAEKGWEKDLLETDFQKKLVSSSHYYCPMEKVPKALTFLLELGWTLIDHQGNRILPHGNLALSAQDQPNVVLIKGKLSYGQHEVDLANVVGVFNRRERFIKLGEGTVGLLPDRDNTLTLLVEESELVQGEVRIPKHRLSTISELFEQSPTVTWDDTITLLRERIDSFSGLTFSPPSERFVGTLRPYQQQGVNWLQFLFDYGFHGILADDMGLGKTVQVLAFLSRIPTDKPHLIIVPTSLVFNWQREIDRFLPGTAVQVYQGTDSKGILLTTYSRLRLDRHILNSVEWGCVILDEAQAIKNADTQTAQAASQLNAILRLSITGTPIENHISELWSHFRFLMPELLGTREAFEAEIRAGESDSRYQRRIQKRIRPFILRRKKEEVLKDLPERIDQVVWVEMQPEQRHLYEEFLAGIRRNLITKVKVDGTKKHHMEILEAILRLRQICCHPLLVQSEEPLPSAKMEALKEDLETIREEGGKALIYSQFTSMLQLIAKELSALQIPFCYLDGSTSNRQAVVDRFQEDPTIPFFLISLKAGGVGLNLTAADYVFIYDPWWNDAVENQAINRAHRIGRHDTVIAKKYIMLESIEEKMMKLKSAKQKLSDTFLEDDLQVQGLSMEDLMYLLES